MLEKIKAPFLKMKDWLGKKAILAVAATILSALRTKYGIEWLPDDEFLLGALAMLIGGHALTDIAHQLSLKKPPPA